MRRTSSSSAEELGGHCLTTLVRATVKDVATDLAAEDALDHVSAVSGGYCLVAAGKPLVAPGCCSDLTDLANWRDAARRREPDPTTVWIGHPWVHVAAHGDNLLLTHPTECDPGPELAWISRRSLEYAVRQAAAEVRYLARPLRDVCVRLVGRGRADALCSALLGGSWLRAGADWLE